MCLGNVAITLEFPYNLFRRMYALTDQCVHDLGNVSKEWNSVKAA